VTGRVFVLGAGRAGRGLARALRLSGVPVVGLHGRRADDAEGVTAGALPPSAARASVVVVTVRDGQLDEALRSLADARLAPGTVVLHASGSAEPPALDELRARGLPGGTFHPLVPLSDPARAAEALRGASVGVDGDAPAQAAARHLAARLGMRVILIPPGCKPAYHAAAVFASNFPVVLAMLAERLLDLAHVPPGDARPAVERLMRAAVDNLSARAPEEALTGPIVRGDVETVRRHLTVLAAEPAAGDAYRALSRAVLDRMAATLSSRVGPEVLAELRELLR
jgi:predicted short-subunit dehydrogenase-like oxidoreductase (DUF2520 family)